MVCNINVFIFLIYILVQLKTPHSSLVEGRNACSSAAVQQCSSAPVKVWWTPTHGCVRPVMCLTHSSPVISQMSKDSCFITSSHRHLANMGQTHHHHTSRTKFCAFYDDPRWSVPWVCGWCHVPSPRVLPALYRFGTSQNTDHMLHLISILNYHCLQEMHVSVKLYIMLQHQNLIHWKKVYTNHHITSQQTPDTTSPQGPSKDSKPHTTAGNTWCPDTPGRSASPWQTGVHCYTRAGGQLANSGQVHHMPPRQLLLVLVLVVQPGNMTRSTRERWSCVARDTGLEGSPAYVCLVMKGTELRNHEGFSSLCLSKQA